MGFIWPRQWHLLDQCKKIGDEGQESFADIGIAPLLDRLHPRAVATSGSFIFRLAGQRTGMTADAAAAVNSHGPAFFIRRLSPYFL
jgi:hypothetical protein